MNTAHGMLAQTEAALAINDVTTASLKNSFVSTNNMESKQQELNAVRIKLADSTLTQPAIVGSDISTLFSIANGCPR